MADPTPPPAADGYLDPDQVATTTFTATFRGWDQSQVAAYLGRVADALRAVAAERDDLAARALDAEARAASAVDVDDATLTARLGDRTAAILAAAHDRAAGIVADAVAREAEVVREAQDEARRLRDGAEAERRRGFEEGAREAEALVSEAERRRAEVDAEVGAARWAALAEVDEIRDQVLATAEAEGRALLAEARAARELVLGDLARRRRVGRQQLEQLKAARERLLGSLGVVKRAVDEATADLRVALPEARFAAEAAARRGTSVIEPTVAELEADIAALRMAGLPLGGLDAVTDAATPAPVPGEDHDRDDAPDRDDPAMPGADGGEERDPRPAGDAADIDVHRNEAGGDATGSVADQQGDPARPTIEAADTGATPVSNGEALAPPVWPAVSPPATALEDEAVEGEPVAARAPEYEAVEDDAVEGTGPLGPGSSEMEVGSEDPVAIRVGEADIGRTPVETVPAEGPATGKLGEEGAVTIEGPGAGTASPFDGPTPVAEVTTVSDVAPAPDREPTAKTSNAVQGADVDALFARLRGGGPAAAVAAEPGEPPPSPEPGPVAVALPDPVAASPPVAPESPVTAEALSPGPGDSEVRVHLGGGPDRNALLARRDAALDPLVAALARRLKRTLADEQNELLDQLRRHDGGDLAAVVPDVDARVEMWAEAAAPVLVQAAAAGARLVDPGGALAREEESDGVLTGELVATIVAPLRARVLAAVEGAEGDVELAADGVRSRYREWRSLRVDEVARHLGHAAFARGAYEAALGSGTPLCWVADDGGVPCPDAEDNALAGPVAPGTAYPTGDLLPPAHPGCRCLLVPASEPSPRAEHQESPR